MDRMPLYHHSSHESRVTISPANRLTFSSAAPHVLDVEGQSQELVKPLIEKLVRPFEGRT